MPFAIDTHAAVRELENGGFEPNQAEALVSIINGAADAQVTKADFKALEDRSKADFKALRADFKALRADFKALEDQSKADFKALEDQSKADFKELRADFEDKFATKADLLATTAGLKTEIAVAVNKILLGVLAIAGLLFAALKLWP